MKLTDFAAIGDVRIVRTAHHLPGPPVSTEAMFEGEDADVDALIRLTGIRTRHQAAAHEATSDLAIAAARPLVSLGPIDRLVVATMSPDFPSPATAPLVQHGLGLPTVPSFDLAATCAGYVYALDAAARAVLTGDEAVVVVAAEARSRQLRVASPGTRCLFGDGASAARVVRGGKGLRIRSTYLGSDGTGHAMVRTEAGGSRLGTSEETVRAGLHTTRMADGAMATFRAIDGFIELAERFATEAGFSLGEIDWVVPHQANVRILERVAKLLRLPLERFVVTAASTGNVGGASVGIALDQALADDRIRRGNRVLLLTAGAGYTSGAALLEYEV